jgi:hypothetical protein
LIVDRSVVERVVVENLPYLSAALGLQCWDIGISYAPEVVGDDGSLKRGECTRLVDYQSAHISLNPEAFDDEDGVLRTLRHELFHVVLSPWDLYSSAIERLDLGDDVAGLLDRVREHALERTVAGLERMWEGLKNAG